MRIRHYCQGCLAKKDFAAPEDGEYVCEKCGQAYGAEFSETAKIDNRLDRCAFCANRAFFVQRDFDQRIGCLVLLVSVALAVLVGWKFGWIWFTPTLLATVLIDWLVAGTIKRVTICYRCDAEYRDVAENPRHKAYDPHIAERYAEKKTVRRMVDEG